MFNEATFREIVIIGQRKWLCCTYLWKICRKYMDLDRNSVTKFWGMDRKKLHNCIRLIIVQSFMDKNLASLSKFHWSGFTCVKQVSN